MAHADLDDLLNAVLPLAQELLQKYGEFFPLGASKAASGQINHCAVDLGVERPASQDVIDSLISVFKQAAGSGEIIAMAICFDSLYRADTSSKAVDAICVRIERIGGEAVTVNQPYKKKLFGGYSFGELVASPLAPEVFAQ